jgi:hypothetical protein
LLILILSSRNKDIQVKIIREQNATIRDRDVTISRMSLDTVKIEELKEMLKNLKAKHHKLKAKSAKQVTMITKYEMIEELNGEGKKELPKEEKELLEKEKLLKTKKLLKKMQTMKVPKKKVLMKAPKKTVITKKVCARSEGKEKRLY